MSVYSFAQYLLSWNDTQSLQGEAQNVEAEVKSSTNKLAYSRAYHKAQWRAKTIGLCKAYKNHHIYYRSVVFSLYCVQDNFGIWCVLFKDYNVLELSESIPSPPHPTVLQ